MPHVARLVVQHLDDRDHQLAVDPAPPGLEQVDDRATAGQFAGGSPGGLPAGVDPPGQRLVRRIAGPAPQSTQAAHQVVEVVGRPWIGWYGTHNISPRSDIGY